MKAMLGIFLYICPYLNYQKCYVFLLLLISTLQGTGEKHRTVSAWKREGRRERVRAEGRGEK
jgi:hypothetical protein